MEEAVIVDAVRTPSGRRNGPLSGWHPAELAAQLLGALATRNDLDPALVDDVVVGCASPVGAQAINVGRQAVLAAGWPETVPATTVDRQCASGQQAVHQAAQGVQAGAYDVVVAAGVEVMSLVPPGAAVLTRDLGQPFPPALIDRYEPLGGLQPQGIGAELVAHRWNLGRDQLDAWAATSLARAARARAEGWFEREIVPVAARVLDRDATRPAPAGRTLTADDTVPADAADPEATAARLAGLVPTFTEGGVITAGNSAQIADGAAAVLIMSATRAAALGLAPRARFHAFSVVGVDPITMLTGPIPATTAVLARAGLTIDDLASAEVNESFAPVVLAWLAELGADPARVNPAGGAIALGHPLGCTGVRLLATVLASLERTGGRWGLVTTGAAGGLATAAVVERL